MVNYLKYFGLTANYTKDELKKACAVKIDSIAKLNIPDTDKYFFIKQTQLLYKQARNDILYRFKNIFDTDTLRINNGSYSSYANFSSYSEKLNNDGTKTIIETIKTNKNGIEEKKTYTYKKYPDGKIEKINNNLLK